MVMKKKKFKFFVKMKVVELSSVPFVSGILFTKIRLKDDKLMEYTNRLEVRDHCVKWNKDLEFEVKLVANSKTGILEDFFCRLSVRKETRGGRSAQKLGYVDLNMSLFAGQGQIAKNYLLQAYEETQRLDNSTLRVQIDMTLTEGFPVFKVPGTIDNDIAVLSSSSSPSGDGLCLENKGDDGETNSALLDTSVIGSLSAEGGTIGLTRTPSDNPMGLPQAKRDSSTASELSAAMMSTIKSNGHVRAQSLDLKGGHVRSSSAGSQKIFLSLRKPAATERDERIDSTRVDAESLVDELLDGVTLDDSQPETGLKLYIGQDGSASVTGHIDNSHTVYKPVNIPPPP